MSLSDAGRFRHGDCVRAFDASRSAALNRILVVDDHPDLAESIALLLRAMGYDARATADPREACGLGREFRPEVALFDLSMPHIDGIALAEMFRSDQELRSVCLIAVTAYSDDKHRTMTRQAGFSAHLKKPIEEAALRSAIVECELKRATN